MYKSYGSGLIILCVEGQGVLLFVAESGGQRTCFEGRGYVRNRFVIDSRVDDVARMRLARLRSEHEKKRVKGKMNDE
jgi:hypothetical protein